MGNVCARPDDEKGDEAGKPTKKEMKS